MVRDLVSREAAPVGPFLVVCPAGVKLNWRRVIALVEEDADVQVLQGKDTFGPWPGAGPSSTTTSSATSRSSSSEGRVGRRDRGRGALHQERVAPRRAGVAARRRCRSRPTRRRSTSSRGRPMTSGLRDLFNLPQRATKGDSPLEVIAPDCDSDHHSIGDHSIRLADVCTYAP